MTNFRCLPFLLLLILGMISPHAQAQDLSVDEALEWGQKMKIVQDKLCSQQNSVKCPTTAAYQLIRVDGTQIDLDVPWYDWINPWHGDPATYSPSCLRRDVGAGALIGCYNSGDDYQPEDLTLIFGGLGNFNVTVDETTGVGRTTFQGADYFVNSCYAKKPQDLDDPSVSQLASDSVSTVQSQSNSLTIDQFRARYFPTYECSLSPDNIVNITQPYAEYASRWVALESIALHTVALVEETVVIGLAVAATDGALAGLLGEGAWGNSIRTVLNLGLQGYGAEQVVKSIIDDVAALGNCESRACRIDVSTDLALNSVMAFDTFRTAQKTLAEAKSSSFADFVGKLTDGSLLFTESELPSEERTFYRLMSHAAIDEDFARLIETHGAEGRRHVEAFGQVPAEWLNEEWFWEYYDERFEDDLANGRLDELTEDLKRPQDETTPGCGRILRQYPDCDGDDRHGSEGLWSSFPGEANEVFDCPDGADPDGGWASHPHDDVDEANNSTSQDDYYFLLGSGNALFAEAEDIPTSDISGNHGAVVHQGASESYSGDGFIDYRGEGYIEWTFDIPVTGDYLLTFGYSLAAGSRPLDLIVNGSTQVRLPFASTGTEGGAWRTPGIQTATLNLAAGTTGIRLQTTGRSGPNMDYLAIEAVEVGLTPVSTGTVEHVFECPGGSAITRAEISHSWDPLSIGNYINGIAFYCGALQTDGDVRTNVRQDELGYPSWFGNDNGTEAQVRCLSNEFVSGATGQAGSWLDQLGLWCRIGPNFGPSHYVSFPTTVGGQGGNAFNSYCPDGHVATGAKVGTIFDGDFLDHFELICTRILIQ